MDNRQGVKMYGPAKWAQMTNVKAPAPALGWSWSDIGSGLLSIGKTGLDWWSKSQQTETYKNLYEQQQAASTQFANKLITIGVVTAVGVLAYKALRG